MATNSRFPTVSCAICCARTTARYATQHDGLCAACVRAGAGSQPAPPATPGNMYKLCRACHKLVNADHARANAGLCATCVECADGAS